MARFLTLSALCVAATVAAGAAVADPPTGVVLSSGEYVAPHITHAAYGELRVVVPLTATDVMVQRMKLRNLSNSIAAMEKWGGSMTVKVVLYARGVSLLSGPDEATRHMIDTLRAHHVQFLVCNNSLAELKIDFHSLYGVTEADVVPSGFLEVAYLQTAEHYVVDPMN